MSTIFNPIKPELGHGIYSIPDASLILGLPTSKIRTWINKYWESEFVKNESSNTGYTWGEKRDKAFDFLTLIEIIAVNSLREIGVSFNKIKLAHTKLSELLNTKYPFAHAKLLSDGKGIFYEIDTSLLEMDHKQQLYFTNLVAPYCKKIDFQINSSLAERYWPLGKKHKIVVDPHHSFGRPIISGTNITADAILTLLNAGESPELIANIYGLELNEVEDVKLFMHKDAA